MRWRMVWRWQDGRAVGGEDVRDSHPLCHGGSGDLQGVAATMTSQSCAAAVIVSNWVATVPSII